MEPANDMSAPPSIPNPNDYPPVSYLTMAYEAVNTRHAIINAIEQNYPGKKTIVLIHQHPKIKLTSSLISIVNVCATGSWPALWLAKLEAFTKVADPGSIAIWWDEDDMFEPDYTLKVIEPIVMLSAVGVWTDKTYYVKKGGVVPGTYPRSNGTLAVKAYVLKLVVPEVRKIHPEGHRVKHGMTLTVDPTLVKVLGEQYPDEMVNHAGMRYYFLRSGGNGGPRRKGTGVNIDE